MSWVDGTLTFMCLLYRRQAISIAIIRILLRSRARALLLAINGFFERNLYGWKKSKWYIAVNGSNLERHHADEKAISVEHLIEKRFHFIWNYKQNTKHTHNTLLIDVLSCVAWFLIYVNGVLCVASHSCSISIVCDRLIQWVACAETPIQRMLCLCELQFHHFHSFCAHTNETWNSLLRRYSIPLPHHWSPLTERLSFLHWKLLIQSLRSFFFFYI